MRPSDIVAGATYHSGRGGERTVVELVDTPNTWLVRYDDIHLVRHLEPLAIFARWARGRVEG